MTTIAGTYVAALLLFALQVEPSTPCPSESPMLIRLTDRNVPTLTTDDKARLSGGDLDGRGVKGSPSLQESPTTWPQAEHKPLSKPPTPPPITVSCVLRNHSYDLIDAKTKAVVERDDWRVTCTVTYKKQKLYDAELPLARPTEFRDAMLAVDEFRTKRAPQLVKEWEDARRSK